jgi:hypothetical protein
MTLTNLETHSTTGLFSFDAIPGSMSPPPALDAYRRKGVQDRFELRVMGDVVLDYPRHQISSADEYPTDHVLLCPGTLGS